MARVKRGFVAKHRRKKVLKMAAGYFGSRHKLFRIAKESVQKALVYAYRDRKTRKRFFRRLWIIRINAMVRSLGMNYSTFMNKIQTHNIVLNRKILSFLSIHHPNVMNHIVKDVLDNPSV
jgi:large subunit ribosomal protein L20